MSDNDRVEDGGNTSAPTGLDLMRAPFQPNQISKLPKPTRKQTDEVKANFKAGIRCKICGGWHHKDVVHLDYVGHAALTDRLLECDRLWNWEPVAFDDRGQPMLDQSGGMWIRLTVCGQTRLGYGHADGKKGGDAIKEVIGDALRNAAMRFGAALDLWHKGDLHDAAAEEPETKDPEAPATITEEQFMILRDLAAEAGVSHDQICEKVGAECLDQFPASRFGAVAKGLQAKIDAAKPTPGEQITEDEIPY